MAKKKTTPPAKKATSTPASGAPVVPDPAGRAFDLFDHPWLLAALLAAAAVAVYWPSLSNGFMVFDDDKAIRYNELIKHPTFRGLFLANNLGMYAPVTWMGYSLVYALAGESARAFHSFSLLLHTGSVLFVFALLQLLQQRREVAFFAALLFALHPMQVEATCWIAGQSALTFSFFYLLSLIAYAAWQQNQRPLFYGLTLLAFLASALAKSAAVTLPLMLLAFDWYRQGNLSIRNMLAKAPFFAISLGLGLYTFATREAEGHQLVVSSKAYSIFDRFLMVCHSLLFYPVKLLAPFELSIFYPMEKSGGSWSFDYYLAPFAVGALVWLAWKYGRKTREIGLGALWYFLPLTVMLPYVSVGTFEMRSDRYIYISSAGFFFLVVWLAQKLHPGMRRGILAAAALLFGFLTLQHSKVWKNEVSVFRNCIQKYPDAPLCNCNLAYGELLDFDFENSVLHYSKTLQLDPSYVEAYNGRGQAYFMLKRFPEAYSDFDNAIRAGIVTPKLFLNRGKCHVILNRPEEAIPDLARSIELEPRNPETYYFKGVAEEKTGHPDQAIQDYSKAIELQPGYIEALVNRGLLYAKSLRYDAAVADYTAALAVNPGLVLALNNRAAAHLSLNQYDKAVADASRAIELQPNYGRAYYIRSQAFRAQGRTADAEADLTRAAQLQAAGQ